MAGSRRWYVYFDDDGEPYGVQLDEDLGNNSGFGFTPVSADVTVDSLPKGTKMRYINAVQTSGDGAGFRYRSFWCGLDNAPLYSGAQTVFSLNGLNYAVTSTRGEKKRKPVALNSGLVGSSPTVGVSTGTT